MPRAGGVTRAQVKKKGAVWALGSAAQEEAPAAGSSVRVRQWGKVGRGRERKRHAPKTGKCFVFPAQSIANSYLGADLVAALPGLDVDDLAHGEVLLVGVAKSSLGESEWRGGVLLAGHEIELD